MCYSGIFPLSGFPPSGLSLAVLRPRIALNVSSGRRSCEELGRVFVWTVPARTVSCISGLPKWSHALRRTITRRLGTESLSPPLLYLLYNESKNRIRPLGGQASGLGTYEQTTGVDICGLVPKSVSLNGSAHEGCETSDVEELRRKV